MIVDLTDEERGTLMAILERQAEVKGVEACRLIVTSYDKLAAAVQQPGPDDYHGESVGGA